MPHSGHKTAILWFADPSPPMEPRLLLQVTLSCYQTVLRERHLENSFHLWLPPTLLPLQLSSMAKLCCLAEFGSHVTQFGSLLQRWSASPASSDIPSTCPKHTSPAGIDRWLPFGCLSDVASPSQEQRLLSCPKMSLWVILSRFNAGNGSHTWLIKFCRARTCKTCDGSQIGSSWEATALLLCWDKVLSISSPV